MRGVVQKLGLAWGVIALMGSLIIYSGLARGGVQVVEGHRALLLAFAVIQAANLSIAATRPGSSTWLPLLSVTPARLRLARLMVILGLSLSVVHATWWLVAPDALAQSDYVLRAAMFFAAVGIMTSMVLVAHWSLSSAVVFPDIVRDLARPWRLLLPRFRRERSRRRSTMR